MIYCDSDVAIKLQYIIHYQSYGDSNLHVAFGYDAFGQKGITILYQLHG